MIGEVNKNKMPIEYITSQKGKPKLVFENFIFVKDKSAENTIYWKCEMFNDKCKSRIHVSKETEEILKTVGCHNHRPVLAKIKASKILTGIKRKATDTVEAPGQIIASASVGIHLAVAAKLPNIKLMKKTVRRARAATNDHPNNTLHPEDLIIPEKYQQTNEKEQFLVYDNGIYFFLYL